MDEPPTESVAEETPAQAAPVTQAAVVTPAETAGGEAPPSAEAATATQTPAEEPAATGERAGPPELTDATTEAALAVPDLAEGRDSAETVSVSGEPAGVAPPPAAPPAPDQESPASSQPRGIHRERQRPLHGNALGMLIEQHFANPTSPCRSYSDLERRSGISREALSRYVTARPDRRRSPTIDTLVAIADAMHLSLEAICRGAGASVKGTMLPPEETQHEREEVLSSLLASLSDEQFSAIVELLRQMHPAAS